MRHFVGYWAHFSVKYFDRIPHMACKISNEKHFCCKLTQPMKTCSWNNVLSETLHLSEIMHFNAAFLKLRNLSMLLHMFAIVYALNHANLGDDTGHGSQPGASSCGFRQKKRIHINLFMFLIF